VTVRIEPYGPSDFETIRTFVESIQEHEKQHLPELRDPGDVGFAYAEMLVDSIGSKQGVILIARDDHKPIGFVCAWIDFDDDCSLAEIDAKYGAAFKLLADR
jgi:hypothetical protein